MFWFYHFYTIYHVLKMSACLKENLGFLKFFVERESEKQKTALLHNIALSKLRVLFTKHCKLDYLTRQRWRKKFGILKRVAINSKNFKEKKRVITQHGEEPLKSLPTIFSALESILN